MMGVGNLVRVAGWVAVLALAVLSLVPGESRPATGLSGHVEHAAAYAGTAFILVAGHKRPLVTAVLLLGYAGCLEMAQTWIPGRHALITNYLSSAIGILIGICTAWVIVTLLDLINAKPSEHQPRVH